MVLCIAFHCNSEFTTVRVDPCVLFVRIMYMSKCAIVYLLRSTQTDVNDIIRSLNSLQTYFLGTYEYPVYVFIEDNFRQDWIDSIYALSTVDKNNLHFHNIQFKLPPMFHDQDIHVPQYIVTHNGKQRWPLGYRHMCRFWSGAFMDDDVIKRYDYVWRMDSDAYITAPITYDVFYHMRDKKIDYAYSDICHDEYEVCEGLYEFSMQYFQSTCSRFQWTKFLMYTTHVEIFCIKRFQNDDYMSFFRAIDKTPGFYMKRWGDAPIRYIAATNLRFSTCKLEVNYIHGNDGSGRRQQEQQEREMPTCV